MKKFFGILGWIAAAAVLIFVAFGFFGKNASDEGESVVLPSSNPGFDLKLPGEELKSVVTVNEVEAKIAEIGELATCEGDYRVTRGRDFSREIFGGVSLPGATNHIELSCSGIVKVGYELQNIDVYVNNERMKIYVTLPQAKIISNQIIWDDVACTEENNLLNPISFAQYQLLIPEIEAEGLRCAEENGLWDMAESNAQNVIKGFLGCFTDYSVEFI